MDSTELPLSKFDRSDVLQGSYIHMAADFWGSSNAKQDAISLHTLGHGGPSLHV